MNNFDVLIGGGAEDALKQEIQLAIKDAIPEPDIRIIIATPDTNLNGNEHRNIVNRLAIKHNGIQIEQSKQARQNFWKEIADAVAIVFANRLSSHSFERVTEHENVVI